MNNKENCGKIVNNRFNAKKIILKNVKPYQRESG
jgi:hypothetical protein